MTGNQKYVIFFCDECELLAHAIALFKQLHPSISVATFSEVDNVITQINEQHPILILVYLSKPDKNYMPFVKDIRRNIDSSAIPILVYQILPDENELKEIFIKLN